jgi:hypothetical protein
MTGSGFSFDSLMSQAAAGAIGTIFTIILSILLNLLFTRETAAAARGSELVSTS